MAGTRHSDSDGSDVFWPGYVDAVTNLVLNLLFLLTIMTVAVFMFALELGRASMGGAAKTPGTAKKEAAETTKQKTDPVTENAALKLEIERLNRQLAKAGPIDATAGGLVQTVDASLPVPKPQQAIDRLQAKDFVVIVRFTDEAVSFTPAEREKLLESLKPIAAKGRAKITVEVPAGFSEARRMAFYRAMAVRNLLIELKMPKANIDVAVRDGKQSANNALVKVRPL